MVSADLIIEARRRAGLTQDELAARLGKPRATVARWETGVHAPSLETMRAIARACGLDLSLSLHKADNSYLSLIEQQLALTPGRRLDQSCAWSTGPEGNDGPFDARLILTALADHDVDFVLVGHLAGVLHGSPIIDGPRLIEIVPRPDHDTDRALESTVQELGAHRRPDNDPWAGGHRWEPWQLPNGTHLVISPKPAGTHGYHDLARDAVDVDLDDGLHATTASLRDLARIAQATGRLEHRELVALRTTLEAARDGIPKGEIPAAAWATLDEPAAA